MGNGKVCKTEAVKRTGITQRKVDRKGGGNQTIGQGGDVVETQGRVAVMAVVRVVTGRAHEISSIRITMVSAIAGNNHEIIDNLFLLILNYRKYSQREHYRINYLFIFLL